jgi:hypothetical protein
MNVSILRLRLAGYCGSITDSLSCGSIDSNEEQKALQDAASSLQAVPILWYRKVREKKEKISPSTTSKKELDSNIESNLNSKEPQPQPPSPTSAIQEDDSLFKLQLRTGANAFTNTIFNDDKEKSEEQKEEIDDVQYYAGIEAVMSVCDTETGPALEIKAHGLQFSIFQDKYDILDEDPDLDLISSFLLEGIPKGQDFLERTIPLSMIDHASPGKFWDWKNMLNISSGNCDCAVKVYGGKSTYIFNIPYNITLQYYFLCFFLCYDVLCISFVNE